MKKLLYAFFALAVAPFCGCSDDDEEPAAVSQPAYAEIDLTTTQFVFPADGGTRTVLVAANYEWSYECDYEWLTVTRSGDELTISADANKTSGKRIAAVSVKAGETGNTARTDIRIAQPLTSVDLAAAGTANCYVASTGTSYKFPAKVKGNGAGDGNSTYIQHFGVEIEGASYADLLWEATFDADKTRSCEIIDDYPIYDDGYVYFSTGSEEGNAVIAVRSAAGEILWSWHIWVTDTEISDKTDDNGHRWMDRNLGALNNQPGDISNRGMLYQWGRKDPFLPSMAAYIEMPVQQEGQSDADYNAAYDEAFAAANVLNMQTGNGSEAWGYLDKTMNIVMKAPGNIDYAVRHPTWFLSQPAHVLGDTACDWYLTNEYQNDGFYEQWKSMLWGDVEASATGYKSIFDPCPAGYVVPGPDTYAVGFDPSKIAVNISDDWDEGLLGYNWKSCGNAYYPCTGMLYLSGQPVHSGQYLLYWTAQPHYTYLSGAACCLFTTGSAVAYGVEYTPYIYDMYGFGARAYGASVRCIKE